MSYEYQRYPAARYHRTLALVVVSSEAEDKALGADWKKSPADFLKPEPKPEPKPPVIPVADPVKVEAPKIEARPVEQPKPAPVPVPKPKPSPVKKAE